MPSAMPPRKYEIVAFLDAKADFDPGVVDFLVFEYTDGSYSSLPCFSKAWACSSALEGVIALPHLVSLPVFSNGNRRYCNCGGDQGCGCIPEAPLPDTSPVADDEGGRWIQTSARESLKSERPGQTSLDTSGVDDRKDSRAPTDVEALRLRLREKDRLRQVFRVSLNLKSA